LGRGGPGHANHEAKSQLCVCVSELAYSVPGSVLLRQAKAANMIDQSIVCI
jgi:hypothetical protein